MESSADLHAALPLHDMLAEEAGRETRPDGVWIVYRPVAYGDVVKRILAGELRAWGRRTPAAALELIPAETLHYYEPCIDIDGLAYPTAPAGPLAYAWWDVRIAESGERARDAAKQGFRRAKDESAQLEIDWANGEVRPVLSKHFGFDAAAPVDTAEHLVTILLDQIPPRDKLRALFRPDGSFKGGRYHNGKLKDVNVEQIKDAAMFWRACRNGTKNENDREFAAQGALIRRIRDEMCGPDALAKLNGTMPDSLKPRRKLRAA